MDLLLLFVDMGIAGFGMPIKDAKQITYFITRKVLVKVSQYLRYTFIVPSVSPREFLETHL